MATAQSTALEFRRRGWEANISQLSDGTSCDVEADPNGTPIALSIYFDRGAHGIAPRAQWLPTNMTTQFKPADTDTSQLVDAIITTLGKTN